MSFRTKLTDEQIDRIEQSMAMVDRHPEIETLPEVVLFRLDSAAWLLEVSPTTVKRYVANGHLRTTGVEGSPRTSLAELIRFSRESPPARRRL